MISPANVKKIITCTGGHADWTPPWLQRSDDVTNVADGVDGVRKAVRRQIKRGVDWVKVMNSGGAPDPENSQEFTQDPAGTWDMLREGAARASVLAEETMVSVREAIGLPALYK